MSASTTKQIIVVKIGGSTLGGHDTTLEDLVALQRQGSPAVVVHGGGATITQWLKRQGVETRFVRGLRVTDAQSLDVVIAVLAGLINKQLVSAVNALGGKAVGLCGVDGLLIEATIQDPELGYVGKVAKVNPEPIQVLLKAGFIPIIAPIAIHQANGSPEAGKPLNINADTVAGDIAAALGAARLIFLTDVEGVLDGSGRLMTHLSADQAQELIASGVASGGMIPKVEAAIRAQSAASITQIIDGREPHALLDALSGGGKGTRIGSD